ncbi:MAG: hypothetical protein ABSH12_05810 [Endomicrobiales bacterium]
MKPWIKTVISISAGIVLVYALVYVDVMLRARAAYNEGEKYWQWYEQPQLKEAALMKQKEAELKELAGQLSRAVITKEDFEKQREIVESNYVRKRQESSIKYAYFWYQTVGELFTPPQTRWSRMASHKMTIAKELWKKELIAKHVPFEDYMLE